MTADSNPTERFPIVTVSFIALNCLVFLYAITLGERQGEFFEGAFALVPARLFHAGTAVPGPFPAGLTLVTSMFLHGGLFHVAGNMLYLWIFGNNVEDAIGRVRFMVFYLLCGVIAAVSHAMTNAQSMVPMIGASGAVSGVLGAYLLLYPQARVLTLFTLGFFVRMIQVPAMVVPILYYLMLPLGAAWFPELFRRTVWGPVNDGIVFALSEFLMAWGVAFVYARHASRRFDPMAAELIRDAARIGGRE